MSAAQLAKSLPTVSASGGGEAIGGIMNASPPNVKPPRPPANRQQSFMDGIFKSRGASSGTEAGTGTEMIEMAEAAI